MLKTGLNRPLMRELVVKLDECEGRMSELLIDSATDENKANSPIKTTQPESIKEVVYLIRTRKGTMRLKKVIDKINDMKMKLGTKVTLKKKLGRQKWILNFQLRLLTQQNESESKMSRTWGKAMTDCLARPER